MAWTSADIWPDVARLRHEVADRIENLPEEQWGANSWCSGWRVRDVLGHLVHMAEATRWSVVRDALRNGVLPDRFLGRIACQLGAKPVPSLARRLRDAAGGRYHAVGTPPAVALGEVIVHAADALRPLGLALDPTSETVAPVLDVYRRLGRLPFHGAPHRGVRLVASDLDWARGGGPEVRGRAVDLLLLMANRRQVLPLLSGPGLKNISG
jgi:uncharacterized protein (TIGR03083 family)